VQVITLVCVCIYIYIYIYIYTCTLPPQRKILGFIDMIIYFYDSMQYIKIKESVGHHIFQGVGKPLYIEITTNACTKDNCHVQ